MIDIRAAGRLIDIGRYCENEYRRILFDVSAVLSQYPDAAFTVLNQRAGDAAAYPVPASQVAIDGTDLGWTLTAADLAYTGEGSCEVIAYSGSVVAKSTVYTVRVRETLDEGIEPPEPWEDYLADLSAIADRAETAEGGAEENALKAEGYAVGRQDGEPVGHESPYYQGNAAYFAGQAGISAATAAGSASAAAGSASAADRSAGLAAGSASRAESAAVAAEAFQTGAETAEEAAEDAQAAAERARDEITGMTAEATTLDPGESATASYEDGVLTIGVPRGADGQDGDPGADGYSPSASVSKSGTTATITITDKSGTTTASISDGEDGQDGHTPEKGVDYWTNADKTEIISAVEDAVEPEISALKSEIDGKAPAIFRSASGDIVSFADGADGMPLSAVVQIDPAQSGSGDPSPTNVRPITGHTGAQVTRTGRNLLQNAIADGTNRGITFAKNSDGTISISGTNDGTSYSSRTINANFLTKPGMVYTLSGGIDANVFVRNVTAGINDTGSGVTFTGDGTAHRIEIRVVKDYAITGTITVKPMISIGAAEYEPYAGTVYPVNWQTAAGTVYGGTVDTAAQTLTVDRVACAMEFTEIYNASGNTDCSFAVFQLPYAWGANLGEMVGESCHRVSGATYTNTTDIGVLLAYTTSQRKMSVSVPYGYTVEQATALFANGNKVCYKLSEPQAYSLSDLPTITTLMGYNALWADTGAISVTYPADTQTYVDTLVQTATDPDGNVVTVTGSTPAITGESGKRYVCGTVDSISITPPGTGIIDVVFTSGTTPTVLTATGVVWPAWFDSTSLNASTVYDITIKDGYGVVNTWS